jgi:hypothetical protein
MKSGDGTVARNPVGNGPARYLHAMFGRNAANGLLLRMAEVVKAECSGDDARRIFDALQTREGGKVLAAILTEINLKVPETVLAKAALDDPAPIARRAEIWLRLDGRALGQRSFH